MSEVPPPLDIDYAHAFSPRTRSGPEIPNPETIRCGVQIALVAGQVRRPGARKQRVEVGYGEAWRVISRKRRASCADHLRQFAEPPSLDLSLQLRGSVSDHIEIPGHSLFGACERAGPSPVVAAAKDRSGLNARVGHGEGSDFREGGGIFGEQDKSLAVSHRMSVSKTVVTARWKPVTIYRIFFTRLRSLPGRGTSSASGGV